jgi:toluene monooxygenase system ferredoxin subunit
MWRGVVESDDGYVCVTGSDELWDGEMAAFPVDGEDILLIRLDGEYHAYDGDCPHQSTPLVEGELTGTTLVCRAHEWIFDARTGHGINPAAARLERHQVRVADGCVWVRRT